jgi:hypothetical protein
MKTLRWIIGYIDSNGAVHHHIVAEGDEMDSHLQVWPGKISSHGKFRWDPRKPFDINTYGEPIDDDDLYRIYDIVERYAP